MAKDFKGINNPTVASATEMFVTPEKKAPKFQKRETKGRRLQLLLPERLYNVLKDTADANSTSMNDIVNQLLERELVD